MPLLEDKGSISHKQMEDQVRNEYEQFDVRRKKYEAEQADAQDLEDLKVLEEQIKRERK
jgi:hypothetical protein